MLEAINRYESNYMNKAGEIADFIRRYELPATKVLMDVFHMNIEEASIEDSIRKISMHWDISILRTATACIRGQDMLNLNRSLTRWPILDMKVM